MAAVHLHPHHAAGRDIETRLRAAIEGEVLFSSFDCGRYATDASIYQIMPEGVVIPRTAADVEATLEIARDAGLTVTMRGGGTSQAGQTVGRGLIVDSSKHLNQHDTVDEDARTIWVEPGVVLDELNRALKPQGLMFPVDISTGSRATIGGMAANNSCGSRSLRYGVTVDNVEAIDATLADGSRACFGIEGSNEFPVPQTLQDMISDLVEHEQDEIAARFPKTARQVGGYNLDRLDPKSPDLTKLLIGSEGTLAFFRKIKLRLCRPPRHKVLGVCHFPSFFEAMANVERIVDLGPTAVELVDRSILGLAREIPAFRSLLPKFVVGEPDALLLVEFAGDDLDAERARLRLLGEMGLPGVVVEAENPAFQSEIWELRKAGLNIAMSMKGDGKPVSFIEDCAVPLAHLAEYTARLNDVFAKHGTKGTWYAHASVGCLHVRPILNLKQEVGRNKIRAIAEEAIDLVRHYKGSHSGEHGDGLVRTEFHDRVFGARLIKAFERVKDSFDPEGILNPGKITRGTKMDDPSLIRFKPSLAEQVIEEALDWSPWGGFLGAAEMCNNNGACRKIAGGVMCPSYRATRAERDSTRGRANSLRLALSGQLGEGALTDQAMFETLELCVGCKACKRECPTGVDMARMKSEFLHHYYQKRGRPLRERLIAHLPRYAFWASKMPAAANLIQNQATRIGFSGRRPLPQWRTSVYRNQSDRGDVLILADCFNRHFEPENLRDATMVLEMLGFKVAAPQSHRPLCCGRTYLAAGMIDEARREAKRTADALAPWVDAGVPIIGLEPSCLLTMRDEFADILPSDQALLFHEFLAEHTDRMPLNQGRVQKVLVHGHCHEKAFDTIIALRNLLRATPAIEATMIESSCCGMAGAFGYRAETYDVSMRMAEIALLPSVRAAADATTIIANGFSCRQQIKHGSGRDAVHVSRLLANRFALH